jgi:phospholipase/carboxylesterase
VADGTLLIAGLKTHLVRAAGTPRLTVALLHGYSMSPDDLAPFAHALRLDAHFVFPEGPLAVPAGGHAWWDLEAELAAHAEASAARDLAKHSPSGRDDARRQLLAWRRGLPRELGELPLVIGGFSQGAMLVADAARAVDLGAAALVLLSSSRLAPDPRVAATDALRGLPVFLSHGKSDPVLAFAAGRSLADELIQDGAEVEFVAFDGGHDIPLVVWRALKRFLVRLCEADPRPIDSPGR